MQTVHFKVYFCQANYMHKPHTNEFRSFLFLNFCNQYFYTQDSSKITTIELLSQHFRNNFRENIK